MTAAVADGVGGVGGVASVPAHPASNKSAATVESIRLLREAADEDLMHDNLSNTDQTRGRGIQLPGVGLRCC